MYADRSIRFGLLMKVGILFFICMPVFSVWAFPQALAEKRITGESGTAVGAIQGEDEFPIYLTVLFHKTEIFQLWRSSGHADALAEAFNHWNQADPAEVPVTCAKCNSTPGFLDFLGADGTLPGEVDNPAPIGIVIECEACHHPAAESLDNVKFPSGALVTGLGAEVACMACHQDRSSTTAVNEAIVGSGAGDNEIMGLGFLNHHHLPAGATLYGSEVKGAYEYTGRTYRGSYLHTAGYETCLNCHDPHALSLEPGDCGSCHPGAVTPADYRLIRTTPGDFDGDGSQTEGLAQEIETMQQALYASIQDYGANTIGTPLVHNPALYPFFFVDTNGDGIADPDETIPYGDWTPRLLRVAYNLRYMVNDPGGYTHNGLYILQVLYDSLEDTGGDVAGMLRPY